jgi:hypothetical protein
MLKSAIVCIMLAATAATAQPAQPWPWEPLNPTPDECPVGRGAHITYGADSIWGVFPNYAEDETYVARYPISDQPPSGEWILLGEPVPMYAYLYHTGLTFQWQEGGALYVIGDDDEEEGDAYLYWYSLPDQEWYEYDIDEDDEFYLGDGACIVYVPNGSYGLLYPVPGWIYCLPGDPYNNQGFWRYAIESSLGYSAIQGIFPPNGSVIADQTPMFQWADGPLPSAQYRLQVSTDELFSTTVIDEVVYASEYQTTGKLANGTYYWHIGTPNGLNWSWGAASDFVLEGGFVRLDDDIPHAIADGAAMAYEADPWCFNNHPSAIALVGGGEKYFYRYDMDDEAWSELDSAPKPAYPGTSLTTNDPTEEFVEWPAAAFGGSTTSDRPWGYNTSTGWFEYPADDFDPFPQPLGPGASFVIGLPPYAYLTTGNNTHYFYGIEPKHVHPRRGRGPQAGDTRAGSVRAQVIARYDGVEVEYQLPTSARVRATLHDAAGRQVGVLDAGEEQPGTHRLSWDQGCDGRKLSAGAYFVLLDMGTEQARLKAVVR